MIYSCLKINEFTFDDYTLVPLRLEDAESIRQWRNQQINILRQPHPITKQDQENYFERVVKPLSQQKQPNQLLFSLLYEGTCIGYGGLVHISWQNLRAEVSFLMSLDTLRSQCKKSLTNNELYRITFTAHLQALKKLAFEELGFHRIFTETFDIRPLHISILEDNNFVLEGRMIDHAVINGRFVDSLLHGCIKKEI